MQNTATACSKCSETAQATTGWKVQEQINLPSYINCNWCNRKDVWDTRTIMEQADEPQGPAYQVGDQVYAVSTRQTTSRMGGRNSTTRRHMEVARVVQDGEGCRYHLRKPGASSRGGEVQWLEQDLEPVEG